MNNDIEKFVKNISEFLHQFFNNGNYEFEVSHYADILRMRRIITIKTTIHNEYDGTKFNEQFTLSYEVDERYFGNSPFIRDIENYYDSIVTKSISEIQYHLEKTKYFQYRKKLERISEDFE